MKRNAIATFYLTSMLVGANLLLALYPQIKGQGLWESFSASVLTANDLNRALSLGFYLPHPTRTTFEQRQNTQDPATPLTWVRTGGPPGGLGYDIRYNFGDPTVWYATDAFSGAHISTDRGYTWAPSNQGIPAQSGPTNDGRPVFSLTVDPHNPEIVWIGTDITGHIYRSTDGGRSWQERDNGVTITHDSLSFRGFTVDPRSSNIVYAMAETTSHTPQPETTGGIVYRTTNSGENWEAIWDGGMPSSLARYMWIDPRDPDVLYVSTGIFDRMAVGEGGPGNPMGGLGILKSIDGGQSWDELDEANGLRMLYIGSLYMHPEDPDVLLAAAGYDVTEPSWIEYLESLETPPNGIYRTENGGENWTQVLTPPRERLTEAFSVVEFCPNPPQIAYAGSERAVYRSEDAGETWDLVAGGANGWGPPGVRAGWPIDLQCDPLNPNRVFANNYMGGNFLSEDGGETWRNASQGYTGAQIPSVQVHPTQPARVFAAGRGGIWRSDNGGTDWYGLRYLSQDYPFIGVEWGAIFVDPNQPNHMLAGEGSIVESWNGGKSWTYRWSLSPESVDQIPDGISIPLMSAFAFAPSDPQTVYASIAERECILLHEPCRYGVGVLASLDGGTSWQQTSTESIGHVGVMDLAVDPADAAVVFAATHNGLFKTTNGGADWSPVGGLPAATSVRAVEMDPTDGQHMLVGVEGLGVYASIDGGNTWQPSYAGLEPNGSLHGIVFDPTNPDIVYASDNRSGVYRSTDSGGTWQKINDGLNNRAVTGLSISADGQHLYVSTNGEGVFRLDLNGTPPVPRFDLFLPLVLR